MRSLLRPLHLTLLAGMTPGGALAAQGAAPPRQTAAGEYTRYELLAPGSGKFRILYEVWATTPGARYFFNPIRRGSVASDERVTDLASGAPLSFQEVDAAEARASGFAQADTGTRYIRVELPRPVPAGGVSRILIDKTYYDPRSYTEEAGELVFTRSLGIKRNSVVLPAGYELVRVNVPSQVLREADGRVLISFINANPDAASLTVRARRVPAAAIARPADRPSALSARLGERAVQSRDIVYFLRQPETHAFDLYHDYTETRPGVDRYLNVVRAGSSVSNPAAQNLDTGDSLRTETLKGEAISRAGIDIGEPVTASSEVVLIRFPAVQQGRSVRLRISETYTDSVRYRIAGDELIWDRSFGRPANAVVLPQGWFLTHSSVPGTVSLTADGRVRIDFVNPRLDEIQVLILAKRR